MHMEDESIENLNVHRKSMYVASFENLNLRKNMRESN